LFWVLWGESNSGGYFKAASNELTKPVRARVYGVLERKVDPHRRDISAVLWNNDSDLLMKEHQSGDLLEANALRDSRCGFCSPLLVFGVWFS